MHAVCPESETPISTLESLCGRYVYRRFRFQQLQQYSSLSLHRRSTRMPLPLSATLIIRHRLKPTTGRTGIAARTRQQSTDGRRAQTSVPRVHLGRRGIPGQKGRSIRARTIVDSGTVAVCPFDPRTRRQSLDSHGYARMGSSRGGYLSASCTASCPLSIDRPTDRCPDVAVRT